MRNSRIVSQLPRGTASARRRARVRAELYYYNNRYLKRRVTPGAAINTARSRRARGGSVRELRLRIFLSPADCSWKNKSHVPRPVVGDIFDLAAGIAESGWRRVD